MSSIAISPTTSPAIPRRNPEYIQTGIGKLHRFVYDRPDSAKLAIKVSGVALIAFTVYANIFLLSLKLMGIVVTVLVTSSVSYGKYNGHHPKTILGHFKTIAASPFDFMIPSKHVMTTHMFNEGSYEECSLKYINDVPVLTLAGSSAERGYAQGFLLGAHIEKLLERWMAILWPFIPDGTKAEELCNHWASLLPEHITLELKGIVAGFNQKMRVNKCSTHITFNQLLLLHLVPDIEHTSAATLARQFAPKVGCTVVMKRENGSVKMGRLMDWPSLNVAGSRSILIQRKIGENAYTQEVGIPGLAGVVTGKSSRGIALAMNVALGDTVNIKGLPAIFINRLILESSSTIDNVIDKLRNYSPIGRYHLSLVDNQNEGVMIHFYQGERSGEHHIRWLDKNPLIVTNANVTPKGDTHPYFNSSERKHNLELFFKENGDAPLEEALKVPLVNNQETVHYVVMEPGKNEIRCAFANAYAADAELRTVPLTVE